MSYVVWLEYLVDTFKVNQEAGILKVICLNLRFAMTVLLQLCEGLIENNGYLLKGSTK